MKTFEGRDWTEISKHFGIDCTNEEEALTNTKSFLNSVMMTEKQNYVASDVRAFMTHLY